MTLHIPDLSKWDHPRAKLADLTGQIRSQSSFPEALTPSSRPLYWKPNNSTKEYLIIIPTVNRKCTAHLLAKYDIQNDDFTQWIELPEEFKGFDSHSGHFIDTTTDKLYIFSINKSDTFKGLLILDLNTKKWTINHETVGISHVWCEDNPQCLFINNKAHFIYSDHKGGHHKIFDFSRNKFLKLNNNAQIFKSLECYGIDDYYRSATCIHIEHLNKIILFGRGASNACVYELNVNDDNGKWKMSENMKLPIRLFTEGMIHHDIAIIKGFDSIIYLIFRFRISNPPSFKSRIWCLDTVENKWYESKKNLPQFMTYGILKTSFCSGGRRFMHRYCEHGHKRICLYDLAPDGLQTKIGKRMHMCAEWKLYVFGYIKQCIESEYGMTIPDYLKRIVLAYYTIFDK